MARVLAKGSLEEWQLSIKRSTWSCILYRSQEAKGWHSQPKLTHLAPSQLLSTAVANPKVAPSSAATSRLRSGEPAAQRLDASLSTNPCQNGAAWVGWPKKGHHTWGHLWPSMTLTSGLVHVFLLAILPKNAREWREMRGTGEVSRVGACRKFV